MNTQTENLIKNHLSIVSRVVGREMARGVMPWVDRSDLEDVGQMALVEAAGKFREGGCPFGAYAYREVHTAVLMELRKLRVRHRGRAEMPEEKSDRQSISGPGLKLFAALSALEPRQYRVVMLHFWGNLTQAQIAVEIGVDQKTVSRIIDSAKKVLRSCLNGDSQTRTCVRGSSGGSERFAGVGQFTQVVQGAATSQQEILA